ncbi:hypothetical protein BC938DRAFT_471826 [Jimgerdemannia flammicorona]|uniref:Uncharacterized protein n=1 Tax=Jimgerdemannia flammicorona TaxID=994334 RepID=A0A433Q7C7_9FUNG|nr:hypothetical protein BC938DRAFT_471826 [Jimgerdemannia flammicorona]
MTLKALEPQGRLVSWLKPVSIDKTMHSLNFDRGLGRSAGAGQNCSVDDRLVQLDDGHGFDVFGSVDTTLFNSAPEQDGSWRSGTSIGIYERPTLMLTVMASLTQWNVCFTPGCRYEQLSHSPQEFLGERQWATAYPPSPLPRRIISQFTRTQWVA